MIHNLFNISESDSTVYSREESFFTDFNTLYKKRNRYFRCPKQNIEVQYIHFRIQ